MKLTFTPILLSYTRIYEYNGEVRSIYVHTHIYTDTLIRYTVLLNYRYLLLIRFRHARAWLRGWWQYSWKCFPNLYSNFEIRNRVPWYTYLLVLVFRTNSWVRGGDGNCWYYIMIYLNGISGLKGEVFKILWMGDDKSFSQYEKVWVCTRR